MHKDIERVLYSEKVLEDIVNRLAKQIEKDYNNKEFLAVGLLKGSVVFMSDIIRRINLDFAIDFMVTSSYGGSTESSGVVNIVKDISGPIDGKNILILEDIIDSGHTLSYVVDYLKRRGAAEVKICTMFDKPERRVIEIEPDYAGTVIPDEFIVGYGLDYDEKYRNLPFVGVLKPEVYNSYSE